MSAPELTLQQQFANTVTTMPVREMYEVSMRMNAAWGIEGYEAPRKYADPKLLAEQREGKQKKPAPKALKKGDYLTETIRATKDIPGPNFYNVVKPWFPEDKIRKDGPKNPPKKNSYIDAIIEEQKRRPIPGPGAYKVRKDEKQIEEEIKAMRAKSSKGDKDAIRLFFLSECEYVANQTPGPGNYHARMPDYKPKNSRKMEPQDWRKKHGDLAKKTKKSTLPDVGTYRPIPVDFGTFDKLMEINKDKDKMSKAKTWGSNERFKKAKKGAESDVPGPGKYNTIAQWNGKPLDGKKSDKKDTNWMNKLSKGIEKSIYYS